MRRKEGALAAVIRFENLGGIIWSPRFKRYYFLEQMISDELYEKIVNRGMKISEALNDMSQLKEKFYDIGVDDDARIIVNKNKTNRPLYAPLEYYFDYTNKCNLRCKDCYNKKHLGQTTMELDNIANIIKEMGELGIKRVYLAGGEPTIDIPALKTYIDTAYENGITTSMVTNGTLLTDELCRYLLSRELVDISVSIDGWDEESNKLRRNDGMFKEAVEGVKRLVKIKKELGNTVTEICVKPIIDRTQNEEFFEKMIALTLELKADKVKFANPERSLNHSRGYYSNDVDSYYRTIDLIASLKKKYADKLIVTNCTNPCVGFKNIGIAGMHGCIGGQELIAIHADGRITPCLMNHIVLGNYNEYGSMKNFYNTDNLEKYAKRIDYPECYDCKLYASCRGGCQVRKIVQCGDTTGRDPICPIENNINLDGVVPIEEDVLMPIWVAHSL